jgi:hypothetical protein
MIEVCYDIFQSCVWNWIFDHFSFDMFTGSGCCHKIELYFGRLN